MVAPETVRVAVFIDWQNVYLTARRAFGLERMPVGRGNFSPYRLGQLLAAANGRGQARAHHHAITQRIFEAVETPINYARRPAG